MKKVCVVGLGYVGLPIAVIAAENGLDVLGFDTNPHKVAAATNLTSFSHHPEISHHLQNALSHYPFRTSSTLEGADYFVIAVETHVTSQHASDLTALWETTSLLAPYIGKGSTIIIESTVPVGTTMQYAEKLEHLTGMKAGSDFYVAYSPERTSYEKMFRELVWTTRIIGGINNESSEKAYDFYNYFVKGEIYLTTATTAELVKLAESSFHDVNHALTHEISEIARAQNIDPFEVINFANKHPKTNFAQPSCKIDEYRASIAPWFLHEQYPQKTSLIKTARTINDNKIVQIINEIKQACDTWKSSHAQQPSIFILGLAHKLNSDNFLASPILEICKNLKNNPEVLLMIHNPNSGEEVVNSEYFNNFVSLNYGLTHADIIVCLAKHDESETIPKEMMHDKIIIDKCGLFSHPKHAVTHLLFKPALELTYYYDHDDQKEQLL